MARRCTGLTSRTATGPCPCSGRAAVHFAKLRHLWADAGHRGRLVAWIKEHLGWSVEVVQKPSRWGW